MNPNAMRAPALSRRHMLKSLGCAGLIMSLPGIAAASAPKDYRLRMTNQNTSEHFNQIVIEDNRWVDESLVEFSRFARDWRLNQVMTINKKVILTALKIQTVMETAEPTILLSGYRSATTNSTIRGAVSKSYHIQGYALDIRQPDRSVSQLRQAAAAMKAGGVGYYPTKNFVHIDCAGERYWNG